MDKTIDVVGLGDLMIDFTHAGRTEDGIDLFARNPAGSMANVLSQVARLGGNCVLVTTLGADEHSQYLYSVAEGLGIDMSCVAYGSWPTRFMFAYGGAGNDRRFSDYRSPRNEAQTRLETVDMEKLRHSHFLDIKAIVFAPDDPIVETEREMLRVAEENGVTVTIDMQWRGIPLPEANRRVLVERARRCGVVKVTDEELAYYYDAEELMSGTDRVLADSSTQIVAVTLGSRGCFLRTRRAHVYCPTYDVPVKDTTGAGDSFMGALLFCLARTGTEIGRLDRAELERIGDFCNACASYSTMNRGSLLGMASLEKARWVQTTCSRLAVREDTRVSAPQFVNRCGGKEEIWSRL